MVEDEPQPLGIFVYGTLMPGRLRWPMIRSVVIAATEAVVHGVLYDTGFGYPAACFDEAGRVEGWLLELDPQRRSRTLDLLDRVEGSGYRRVEVETTDGHRALAYEWLGPREGLAPLPRWDIERERSTDGSTPRTGDDSDAA
jgi:gamma-glutamylcyclotransferase (GGCT)/AIG2-like uncharacterized protein YtfP